MDGVLGTERGLPIRPKIKAGAECRKGRESGWRSLSMETVLLWHSPLSILWKKVVKSFRRWSLSMINEDVPDHFPSLSFLTVFALLPSAPFVWSSRYFSLTFPNLLHPNIHISLANAMPYDKWEHYKWIWKCRFETEHLLLKTVWEICTYLEASDGV